VENLERNVLNYNRKEVIKMRVKIKTLKWFLAVPFILFVFFGHFQCKAELDEGKYYVRISSIENSLIVQRSTEIEAEEAIVNMPLMAGDRVWTVENGRAELAFEDGTTLRIAHFTKLDFQAVSYYSDQYDNSTILRLWSGSIYIDAINIEDARRNFQIDTPSSSIYLISDGRFRIDVFEDGETRLTSLNGVAEIVNAGDSILVKSGQRSYAKLEGAPSTAESFNSFEMDEFDKWNQEQDERYAEATSQEYVTEHVVHHVYDLDYYGDWAYHPGLHTHVWRPHVSMGWRPYTFGYWRWYPCGWMWISHEPWGWAPYHYGWWDYTYNWGWYWIPHNYWGPAWVSWAVGPNYIGWRPIGYKYNYYNFNRFDPNHWTFIPRNAIVRKDIRKVKFTDAQIRQLNVTKTQLYQPRTRTAHNKNLVNTPAGKTVIKDVKTIPRDIAKTRVNGTKINQTTKGKVYSHDLKQPNKAVIKDKNSTPSVKTKSGTTKPTTRSSGKTYTKTKSQNTGSKVRTTKPKTPSKVKSSPKSKSTKTKSKPKPNLQSSTNRTSKQQVSRTNLNYANNQNKSNNQKTQANTVHSYNNNNYKQAIPKHYTQSRSSSTYQRPNMTTKQTHKNSYQDYRKQLSQKNFSNTNKQNKSYYQKTQTNTLHSYNNNNYKQAVPKQYSRSRSSSTYQRPTTTYRQTNKNNYSGSKSTSLYNNRRSTLPKNTYRYSRPSTYSQRGAAPKIYNRNYSNTYKNRTYAPSSSRSVRSYTPKNFFNATRSTFKPSYRSYSGKSYSGRSSYKGGSRSIGSRSSHSSRGSFKSSSSRSSSRSSSKSGGKSKSK